MPKLPEPGTPDMEPKSLEPPPEPEVLEMEPEPLEPAQGPLTDREPELSIMKPAWKAQKRRAAPEPEKPGPRQIPPAPEL